MTCHQDVQGAGRPPSSPLTAHDYRLLADRFLAHLGADLVRNDSLNYLAQRLLVLAVQAERSPGGVKSPSSLTVGGGTSSARSAPISTPTAS